MQVCRDGIVFRCTSNTKVANKVSASTPGTEYSHAFDNSTLRTGCVRSSKSVRYMFSLRASASLGSPPAKVPTPPPERVAAAAPAMNNKCYTLRRRPGWGQSDRLRLELRPRNQQGNTYLDAARQIAAAAM